MFVEVPVHPEKGLLDEDDFSIKITVETPYERSSVKRRDSVKLKRIILCINAHNIWLKHKTVYASYAGLDLVLFHMPVSNVLSIGKQNNAGNTTGTNGVIFGHECSSPKIKQ